MSRVAQPGVNPNAIQQAVNQVHQANTPVRESRQARNEPQKQGGSSSSSSSTSAESRSALGTSTHVAVPPNAPREDAGQQQRGGGQGQGQGPGAGAHGDGGVQRSLNKGDAAMAQAAATLSMPTASTALLGKGRDSVLLNLAPGLTTYAQGSLIPRKYAQQYQKHTLGRYRDIWDEEDQEQERRPMTPEEYEAIVDEMTAARINEGRAALLAMSRLPQRRRRAG